MAQYILSGDTAAAQVLCRVAQGADISRIFDDIFHRLTPVHIQRQVLFSSSRIE